ncbi:MAG: ImmA/IrrE family metallo-endopeptidase [Oscillospiraceae bacterium]|nr:ImmA/IrrE family metallo-endopeptidase [Oscillospiraceae bacterium]
MTDLLDLYNYAEERGTGVYWFTLEYAESLSYCDPDGDCFVALDPGHLYTLAEEKVKLSHELGHCETGSFYNRYAACEVREKHENRADKWAIERVVGREELNAAVASGHTELWDLADFFGVTEEFMRKAVCWYKNGNLATEYYP